MKKFTLELPKFRLELNYRFVKRRKPLVPEPILPTPSVVNKKYRKGTLLGKVVRHVSEHKITRKFFAANIAAIVIVGTLLPSAQATQASDMPVQSTDATVIQTTDTPLITQDTIRYPLDVAVRINQEFSAFHPGVDLGAEVGNPIKPFMAGRVVEAGYVTDGYGNTILVDHGNGITSRYAHLSKIDVKVGDSVTTNTEIGRVGLSGHTTGPHLHFEIRINGNAINPCEYITCKN